MPADVAVIETASPLKEPTQGDWLRALRAYLLFVVLANLAWEILQLPFYTLISDKSAAEVAFAIVHCTAGDVLIAMASLVTALIILAKRTWPAREFWHVAALTVCLGFLYTIFSEWLNLVVRESWAYSEYMPVIPLLNVGLTPLLQWIVIPLAGLRWIERRARPPRM